MMEDRLPPPSADGSSSTSLRIRWFQKSLLSPPFVRLDPMENSNSNSNSNNNNNRDDDDNIDTIRIPNDTTDASSEKTIITFNDDDDHDHHHLALILWNMLRIAAHEETLEPVQSNPDLAKYVLNIFHREPHRPPQEEHQNMTTTNTTRHIVRMGVIADWIGEEGGSKDAVVVVEEQGIGAAWIQTWSSSPSSWLKHPSNSLLQSSDYYEIKEDQHGIKDEPQEPSHDVSTTTTTDATHATTAATATTTMNMLQRPPPPPRGYGWVRDDIPELAMGIVPNYQGRGIGTQLLAALIQRVQEYNNAYYHRQQQQKDMIIPAISLSVREDNLPAVRLYQRHGFKPIPGTQVKNRVGTMSYTMIRWLIDPEQEPCADI